MNITTTSRANSVKAVPKNILNKKYKNLLRRGTKKQSLDIKKNKNRSSRFNFANENVPKNSSMILKAPKKKSTSQREFTGRALVNFGDRKKSCGSELRTSSTDICKERLSSLLNKSKNHDQSGYFLNRSRSREGSSKVLDRSSLSQDKVHKRNVRSIDIKRSGKSKRTVEKILKELENKRHQRSYRFETSNTRDQMSKDKSFSMRLRESDCIPRSQNLFNDHFVKKSLGKRSSFTKKMKSSVTMDAKQQKSSSMSNLDLSKGPLIDVSDQIANPPDSKRSPLDNYFKVYLSQCKSIKFTSPETDTEVKREPSTVHEHNSKNSEFIQNLRRYLHEPEEGNNRIDFNTDEELIQSCENQINAINVQECSGQLKTRRKFNNTSKESSPMKRDTSNKRFEFSTKVLGNLDYQSRKKFFKKQKGYKYTKSSKNLKEKANDFGFFEEDKVQTRGNSHKLLERLGNSGKYKASRSRKNSKEKSRSRKKTSSSLKKKNFTSFRREGSRDKSKGSIKKKKSRKRNQSAKTSNSNYSTYKRSPPRIFADDAKQMTTFDSSVMSKEIKDLTDELKKLKFTKEKITEFNEIFLPYLDFTFNLEIENKNLKSELEKSQQVIKELESKVSEVKIQSQKKFKEYDELLDDRLVKEKRMRNSYEKSLFEVHKTMDELKKQNEILNDVLKGLCQEKENEERPTLETNTSFKFDNNNNCEIPKSRRESIRRSPLIRLSRNSLSVPKIENGDEILELRYDLKLAQEEIQDFKVNSTTIPNLH